MTTHGGTPRFDDSLATVAQGLHLGQVLAGALVAAMLLFVWLERRGRSRWAQVPITVRETAHGPYRSSAFVAAHLRCAPSLVRVASFGCLFVAHVFGPLILLALIRFPFDGIAIPLVPGMALVLGNWCCAWLLLARSPLAEAAAKTGAKAALVANVGLLCLAASHFVVVELGRREGIQHACSSSVTFLVLVFAIVSVLQALVTIAALRSHRTSLTWLQASTPASAP